MQVLKGLAHLHGLGVLHQDIKQQNMLLSSTHGVQLGKFMTLCHLAEAKHLVIDTTLFLLNLFYCVLFFFSSCFQPTLVRQ
jgi:serine/threonine protein kinase